MRVTRRLVGEQLARRSAPEGVAPRRLLHEAGVPPWFVERQVKAGRWRAVGRSTVVLHNGPTTPAQRRAACLYEAGPRAALAGVSALQQAGMQVGDDGLVHLVVPRGGAPLPVPGARVHESRRFQESDVVAGPPRRVRPALAAVQAALWARTDREATLLLTLVVQERRATPEQLAAALEPVLRHRRRQLVRQVLVDLAGGAESLGELDVGRAMRRRGLPEPVRQALRRRPSGTQYLDADFPRYGVTLEVDGAAHDLPEQRLRDLLRDVDLGAEGRTVVRVPLVAWRLGQEQLLDALERLFASRGWRAAS